MFFGNHIFGNLIFGILINKQSIINKITYLLSLKWINEISIYLEMKQS